MSDTFTSHIDKKNIFDIFVDTLSLYIFTIWKSIVYNLLDQGYKKIRLIRSLKKFIFRYQDLVEIYSVYAEKIINEGFSYSENV
jgi:hypothetical protein